MDFEDKTWDKPERFLASGEGEPLLTPGVHFKEKLRSQSLYLWKNDA